MRFSFIIPAYNAERTIERCIESIMSDVEQYGNECEILVVDNESTDNSNQLILEFTKKYPYISLHECSKGVSRARNTGIKAAKGEKIIFVDSDDLWVPGSLEAIDKILIANDTQLIQFAYYKNDSLIKHNIETDKVVTQNYYDKYRAWMIAEPTVRMQVWAKAFDRQVMLKNNIYFNEDLSYSEDGDFVFRYMQNAKNMIVVNLPIYRYCQDYGSTMRQHSNSKILVGGGTKPRLNLQNVL